MWDAVAIWVADITTLFSTLTMVVYQGKTVSLPPARSPHAITFDIF